MALPVNFLVYGKIYRENGIFIAGATVRITDQTIPQGTASGITDANGKYLINIKNYATNGDAIRVSCTYQQESKTSDFTLDVGDGTKEVNLNLVVTQIITIGAKGDGPAVYIQCQQCGYNNYYPKPSSSYCCHSCQTVMDKDGKTGGCVKIC